MFGKVITEEPVVPKYFLDRYNIQEISDKAVDACVLCASIKICS